MNKQFKPYEIKTALNKLRLNNSNLTKTALNKLTKQFKPYKKQLENKLRLNNSNLTQDPITIHSGKDPLLEKDPLRNRPS